MWQAYALLAAFFAALTVIFSKIGLKDVNSNLALAIRTGFILLIVWAVVVFNGEGRNIKTLNFNTWAFLALSAVATALSWLFYFKALQLGEVSRIAPIDKLSVPIAIILAMAFLGEPVTLPVIIGGTLITIGAFVMLYF